MASIGLFIINSLLLTILVAGSLVLQSTKNTDAPAASNPAPTGTAAQTGYDQTSAPEASATPAPAQVTQTTSATPPAVIPSVQRIGEHDEYEYDDD